MLSTNCIRFSAGDCEEYSICHTATSNFRAHGFCYQFCEQHLPLRRIAAATVFIKIKRNRGRFSCNNNYRIRWADKSDSLFWLSCRIEFYVSEKAAVLLFRFGFVRRSRFAL